MREQGGVEKGGFVVFACLCYIRCPRDKLGVPQSSLRVVERGLIYVLFIQEPPVGVEHAEKMALVSCGASMRMYLQEKGVVRRSTSSFGRVIMAVDSDDRGAEHALVDIDDIATVVETLEKMARVLAVAPFHGREYQDAV